MAGPDPQQPGTQSKADAKNRGRKLPPWLVVVLAVLGFVVAYGALELVTNLAGNAMQDALMNMAMGILHKYGWGVAFAFAVLLLTISRFIPGSKEPRER